MKDHSTIKVIFIAALFAIGAYAAVTYLPASAQANCDDKQEQLTECQKSGSLPDIELMRNAAARAKDIFSIVSKPIIR